VLLIVADGDRFGLMNHEQRAGPHDSLIGGHEDQARGACRHRVDIGGRLAPVRPDRVEDRLPVIEEAAARIYADCYGLRAPVLRERVDDLPGREALIEECKSDRPIKYELVIFGEEWTVRHVQPPR
jgi:hypothetical protein